MCCSVPLGNSLTPLWALPHQSTCGFRWILAQDTTVPVALHPALSRCVGSNSDVRCNQGSGHSPTEGTGPAEANDGSVGVTEVRRTGRRGQ